MARPPVCAHGVMGAPRSAGSSMSERASGVGSSLGDAASSAKDQLTSTPQRIEERTQGNPLAAGAIAFGIGVLIGSAAPPSQEEQQLAEQVTPMLKDEAQAIAHEVADTAKTEAQDHLQQVKGEASDSAERVKAKAQEAADTTKDHASEATGRGVVDGAVRGRRRAQRRAEVSWRRLMRIAARRSGSDGIRP